MRERQPYNEENEKWEMGNGKWEMGNRKRAPSIPGSALPSCTHNMVWLQSTSVPEPRLLDQPAVPGTVFAPKRRSPCSHATQHKIRAR
eukprot:scaffold3656_cov254-Pinguiococcus_pyrenoidosus.AAC.9